MRKAKKLNEEMQNVMNADNAQDLCSDGMGVMLDAVFTNMGQ